MVIAYYSRTGNVRDFVHWYLLPALGDGHEAKDIEEWDADKLFILATPTYDFGEVPEEVTYWLNDGEWRMSTEGRKLFKGVIGSGNRNWGDNYAKAANTISESYGVPLIGKFELKGSEKDADEFAKEIYQEANPWIM